MSEWEVRVDGLLLPYVQVEWTDPLSGVGSGKAVVNADDSRWADHQGKFDVETVWVASLGGTDRFAWLGEDVVEELLEGGGTKATISGRGLAAELERGVVVPSGYPSHTVRERELTGAPMEIWRTLLAEAQGRGVLSGWSTSFTDSADTDGTSWAHTFVLTTGPGANLLDLLSQLADAEQCEWRARPDRTLDAWRSPGSDLSGSVRWYMPHQVSRQTEGERVAPE